MLGTNCDQCVSMVQCCFTSTETVRLIRTGSPGRPPRLSHLCSLEVEEGGDLYLLQHCHHQNDSCIKMGSDDSHSNVALIVRGKGTRQCPQTKTFEDRGEPKRNRTEVLLLSKLTN